MQTGFNRAFGGLSDMMSINSSNVFYPLGGIRNFRSLLASLRRFPLPLAVLVCPLQPLRSSPHTV